MNDDNDKTRRMVERCYRTTKTMVNPIIDWEESDVWEFLNSNNIQHCCLYDEGYTRIGCIGCPLGGSEKMKRDFERWPKYKNLYIKAFQKMIDNHPGEIKVLEPEYIELSRKRSEESNRPFVNRTAGGVRKTCLRSGQSINKGGGTDGKTPKGGLIGRYIFDWWRNLGD